ncbi:MAG: class II glutamine amidotransferase [Deltaproteobacteria bacterium]|nr:MAG: class II glutamine amidotransferase [Deltaproteobacteria bacterium]
MCRLFGFRSVIRSQVHRSLVSAENALSVQSERHPDGWGVAYYVGGAPHLIKSADTAVSDRLFHRVSGIVSSETVLAHLRKATQGRLSPVNAHPFQYGRWVFAHNGNVAGFTDLRDELMASVHPEMRRWILGETDSELLFYLLLTRMRERHELHAPDYPATEVARAVQEVVHEVTSLTGGLSSDLSLGSDGTYLTFLLTNGATLVAHHGGMPLYYSTWKRRCPERDLCPSFGPSCEAAAPNGVVNHLIFSSEPLQGENVWLDMDVGQIIAIDHRMRVHMCGHSSAPSVMI